ncbi:DEAD/DEAH box helicase family protein [Limnothrix sp. FACHB-1083]|uniref:type I restriction endonuclease subunit R n=1 Tax=unclassified Limnothrix TaxID=2632864 RepID=UPI00168018D9|nr:MULTISPECIES: type I restriction-modification enzyme R subunit C-terminal domain-containing protein [unclassified Limnothrix]MBD2162624.1 DEAD/DEAH box helicase family protein [Limnothrix sp. FACHB-1083]MBD2193729.1 DEAD/DEAH box helicase family protein [Limnothrix sp. FACHB-1088]
MTDLNQNPEQQARDQIDAQLRQAGWDVQSKNRINLNAALGVAIREYPTDVGPADYVLFVDRQPVGIIEAKREHEGHRLTVAENQTQGYATAKLKHISNNESLPFLYESTGVLTRFTDRRDPKPRSRPVFSFHRPETFQTWLKTDRSLRARLLDLPGLDTTGLRDCQTRAIQNLEHSFKDNRPRALVQMATGSGKTFTAITAVYRLLKFAKAERVLFLVDTKNLGEQAEQEFMAFSPVDDNRKFTELYNVQRLKSRYVATDSQVCISTIQRLYSILKGEELDEKAEEVNPNELIQPKAPMPVVYNPKIPIEFFDFIIIDECHRSIYKLWRQVLEYFDGFLIGLTATPDQRTFGFFNENIVSEYTHEEAVTDGVNVGFDVYTIETEITKQGSRLVAKEFVDKRDKLTRKRRWEQLDEDLTYSGKQLDRDVVNPSQIRNIIRTFRDKLPEIFPNRQEVPKTLIFAKTDSHADDIIQTVREEFGEENAFCKKVTYQSTEDPKSVLAQFRNDYYPRIAVTVDMIATGTDVKPLECLLFMRDVKSRNYFEQMKGRGTRTLGEDDLKKVTPSVRSRKTHFVIVDAIGVTKSLKTDSRPLERKQGVSLRDLMMGVMMGAQDEDSFTSLAGRLARLEQQMNPQEREQLVEMTGGLNAGEMAKALLRAYDLDVIADQARTDGGLPSTAEPSAAAMQAAQRGLIRVAASAFTGEAIDFIENVRRVHEQIIDVVNLDRVTAVGWDVQATERAMHLIEDFTAFIEHHKDEITALKIYYNQPYQRRDLTFQMIREVLEILKAEKPMLAPLSVWQAYEQVEGRKAGTPISELTALVALIRKVVGLDQELTPYQETVNRNFKRWVFQKQAGAAPKFTEVQMEWLRMVKDHMISSFHLERDDLDYAPFDAQGGLAMMYQLFGDEMDEIIDEMNEVLAA